MNKALSKGLSQISQFVYSARYDKAFAVAKKLLQKFPNEPHAQFEYAILLGDNQEGLTPTKIEKNRVKAVSLLKKVIQKLDRIPESRRYAVMNEFYWLSKQPLKQYQLGLQQSRNNEGQGLYSQGVGAVSYAISLARKDKFKEAEKWAKKANQAWLRYYEVGSKKYYNAYCWHAQALGILGEYEAMEDALEIARMLSGRDVNYEEFVNVRKDVYEVRDNIEHKRKLFGSEKPRRPKYWYLFDQEVRSALIKLESRHSKCALSLCKSAQSFAKKFPANIYVQSNAAALWGDWGQYLQPKIEQKMKKEAVKKLLLLKKKMKKEHWAIQHIILNEIAYHSGNFLGQYKLGLRRNKIQYGTGYFSMGVGASEYANQLFQKGKIAESRKWAKIAVNAWETFASASPNNIYYNLDSNAFYAQATALNGNLKQAWKVAEKIKNEKIRPNNRWYNRLRDRLLKYQDLMINGKT